MPVSIAIVGAGPSGFYTAQALLKTGLDCRIDIIERLPTPYGLVRAGVAPDHQTVKRVAEAYERTALDGNVNYYGNVDVGNDVTLFQLRRFYDAVVLSTGAPLDRTLSIPGNRKAGVYGSGAFVGWYNGHPNFRRLAPDLECGAVAVIGNDNVTIDVARVLAKTPDEMATADLAIHAAEAIHRSPVRDIYILGRRGPVEAKFTNTELREMGKLTDCRPVLDASQIPAAADESVPERERRLAERNLATLRDFAARPAGAETKRIHFVFNAQPVKILGDAKVNGLRLERTQLVDGEVIGIGDTFDIPCGLVVGAIGYRMETLEGLPIDRRSGTVINRDGRAGKGLYVAGWAKRGSNGVIGTNKADGDVVANHIRTDFAIGRKSGRVALERTLKVGGVRWVSFGEWQEIDAVEVAAAPAGAPRRKLTRVDEMLAVVDKPDAAEAL